MLVNQALNLVFEDADDVANLYTDDGKVVQILRDDLSNALRFSDRVEGCPSRSRANGLRRSIAAGG